MRSSLGCWSMSEGSGFDGGVHGLEDGCLGVLYNEETNLQSCVSEGVRMI